MDTNNIIFLVVIIFCLIMSAYFSATETAFSSFNKIRMKNMADKGNKKARKVLAMAENYDTLLSTILIGNNIVNIASASLATMLFVDLMGEDLGPGMSTLITTIVVLIFGEVSPKSIAKESPEKFAMFSAPFLNVLTIILFPFNFLFKLWKKLLSKIIRPGEKQTITEEELLTFVEETRNEGGIDEQESSMIRSVIDFSDLEAVDILTPRIDVEAIPADASKDEIAKVFLETGYSRLPVYEDTIDNIVGILYQKDFHNYAYHTDMEITKLIKPAAFIPERRKIRDLLKELQSRKLHLAVVIDEFGGTIGIVTMEDILEELVGEIWDEHDEIVDEIKDVSDNEYIVLGGANIEKLFEKLHIEEEVSVTTVNGWIMDKLPYIPVKGDEFEFKNWKIKVLEMDGKRVGKVSIKESQSK